MPSPGGSGSGLVFGPPGFSGPVGLPSGVAAGLFRRRVRDREGAALVVAVLLVALLKASRKAFLWCGVYWSTCASGRSETFE